MPLSMCYMRVSPENHPKPAKNFCFYEKGCNIATDKRLISRSSPLKQLISYLPIPFNINSDFQK
jgi:hypothetical protein